MSATELAFRLDVNVSIAIGNGRFSAVDQWPVLGVHRGASFLAGRRFAGHHARAEASGYGSSDRYLLGLARRYGGRVVTCDHGLAVAGGDDVIDLLNQSS